MHNAKTRTARSRFLLVTAGVATSALALVGCAGGGGDGDAAAAPGEKTTIRFLYATGDETWNAVVDEVVTAFNEQSDTTEVKLDPLPAGSDYATALKTVDATGNWPAVVDMRDTLTYVDAGKLAGIPEEVTELLEPDAFAAAEDGEVYTVPYSALNGELGMNIVYNKTYFKEHKLEVPETYDDFIDLLEEINSNGDVPLATAAAEVWPADQLWKPLAAPVFAEYSDEGGFWNAAAEGQASVADLKAPLEELKMIMDEYVLEGWQSTADAQTTTLLVNDQAVMATSSAGLGRLMDINKVDPEFDAGLFIIPDEDGKINVLKNSVVGDTAGGLAISAQAAEDEDEYASAVEFLTYFYSVDAANLMEASGWISPNIVESNKVERNDTIPGAEDFFGLLENPNLVWYENAPTLSTFSSVNTFFRQSRIEMQDGQTTIDETIAKVQAELEAQVAAAG
ncbi:ABC transporter substrate-binding protein [Microbacterium sp. SA39]|uniref:ABC transporter substrate-binding protein n=1 Tax=Microbacterium sp. SA39 TaxID=1263625 RepID=UPI0005F9AC52|nr:ABC transporter substrate-binding protein [Microbacterium sp. SA39]KJQ52655.1 Multiple sugar-binding protein precursor [Microbacterium sp. SA39]